METNLTVEVTKIIDEYNEHLKEIVDQCAEEEAKKLVKVLKATSPRGNRTQKKYASGWAVKKKDGGYIVHNKTNYQLTHLLENGHIVRNQYGSYDRVSGQKHIEPAEKDAIKDFEQLVRERLNR